MLDKCWIFKLVTVSSTNNEWTIFWRSPCNIYLSFPTCSIRCHYQNVSLLKKNGWYDRRKEEWIILWGDLYPSRTEFRKHDTDLFSAVLFHWVEMLTGKTPQVHNGVSLMRFYCHSFPGSRELAFDKLGRCFILLQKLFSSFLYSWSSLLCYQWYATVKFLFLDQFRPLVVLAVSFHGIILPCKVDSYWRWPNGRNRFNN